MSWRLLTCLWVLLACALCALDAQTPPSDEVSLRDVEPTLRLRSERNLVIVRVVVRDGTGATVDNLQQQDFQLFDRGKKQSILDFRIENPLLKPAEPPASKPAEDSTATIPRGSSRRHVVGRTWSVS